MFKLERLAILPFVDVRFVHMIPPPIYFIRLVADAATALTREYFP